MSASVDLKKDVVLNSSDIQQDLLNGDPHWASLAGSQPTPTIPTDPHGLLSFVNVLLSSWSL